MCDKTDVFDVIKSVITSQKGGVLLKNINGDYRNLAGESIPYENLGYHSIKEVLDDIPEVHSFINSEGDVVFMSKGKNCEHLFKLISKQKDAKNRKCKPSSKSFCPKQGTPRLSKVEEAVKQCSEHQESDIKRKWKVNKSIGGGTYLGEKTFAKGVGKSYNNSLQQKLVIHSRKSDTPFHDDFSGYKGREWEPYEEHLHEMAQHEHWQENYDSRIECRTYLLKSSKSLDTGGSSRGVHKCNPRDLGRSKDFDERLHFHEGRDEANSYSPAANYRRNEKLVSLSRPKSFRSTRTDLLEDYPHQLCRSEDFDPPVERNPYRYSNPKYRSRGNSRHIPEVDDWNRIFFLGRRPLQQLQMW
ncbi:uncharacterized protein [Hetaerina americana]|uniref:uncharacterized protein isoform X2 n=1 Tax=Hetaerina americana TaxID=62018 RepID=UPI003A7F3D5F